MSFRQEFYLDVDTSKAPFTYSLLLKEEPGEPGIQLAIFNPYAFSRNPGLMEQIVTALNKQLLKNY